MRAAPASLALAGKAVLRHWRTKALLQKALSTVPGGQQLNYLLQRRITHGIPIPNERLAESIQSVKAHLVSFERHTRPPLPLADATFFEFGAGWDLHIPLTLFALGVGTQIVVDRTPHARADLVDDVVGRLSSSISLEAEAVDRLRQAANRSLAYRDLKDKVACFGISYRAPADARFTGIPPGSVDCVTSTSTFEHLAEDEIVPVLQECHRMLKPKGVASFFIDYSDHYSHFDPAISPFNFLRYSERRWRLYNSSLQFQNRLRHSQYLAMFGHTGFEVVDQSPSVTEAGLVALRGVCLAEIFTGFEPRDLAATSAHVVLKKPG